MEIELLKQIIGYGENARTEFKRAAKSVPIDCYETIVSFSNTEGGNLILGVDDFGEIQGVQKEFLNKVLKNLVSAINSSDNINPPLFLQPIPIEISGLWVVMLQVPVSSQVHNYKGNIYVREFESDINISKNHLLVSDLFHSKRNVFTENEIFPHLEISDLDSSIFETVRNLIRSQRSDHPWLALDDFSILKEAVLWRKDFVTGEEGLTLAAALIFGKETTVQSIVPAYKVEAVIRKENIDRWDDRLTLRKNLIETYLELKSFINKWLPERFFIENGQRVDLRDRVFREVIGNVIVHREYSSALATEIVIDKFQLTATNPNKAHYKGPIDLDSFNPFAKNPNIRKFFTALGWTDEIGSGIRNTKRYLTFYVDNAQPIFIEGDVFKTIIPLQYVTLRKFAKQWLSWLDVSDEYLEHLQKSLGKVEINARLVNEPWESVLLNLVPSWNRKGIKLDGLDWPKNQVIDSFEIQKVPGWSEKGTKLIHKKVRYIIVILSLSATPIKLEEIMLAIGYSNKAVFRDNYMKPLEKLGLITKTNLTNVTSPNQKYKLTKTGSLFLGNQD